MFSTGSRLRSAAADTFALVVYCFVIGMIIEIVISGMTFQQSLSSRLVSIPVSIEMHLSALPIVMLENIFWLEIWQTYWHTSVSSHRSMR